MVASLGLLSDRVIELVILGDDCVFRSGVHWVQGPLSKLEKTVSRLSPNFLLRFDFQNT
jgi:hypothetical protein